MNKKTIKFYDKDAADHKFGEGGDTPIEIALTSANFGIDDSKQVGDISYAYLNNFFITSNHPIDVKNKNLTIVMEIEGDITQFRVIASQTGSEGGIYLLGGVCASMFELSDEYLIEYGAKLVIS